MNNTISKRPPTRLLLSLLQRSRCVLAIATVTCIFNGVSSVLLITLINRALIAPSDEHTRLGWSFSVIAVLALICRVLGGVMFSKLSQGTMAKMREHISARVAHAPLRQIEMLGAARAQSIVTEDATNVSLLFFALPNIVIQGSIVLGCLSYLAWLSWPVFFMAIAAVIIGSIGYSFGGHQALASLRAAGKAQDRLFSHFNALFAGAKELKLHHSRTKIFLTDTLGSEIEAVRHHRTRAFGVFAFGIGWILFLFYVFLGLVVFSPSEILDQEPTALAGYVIVFLFMLMPLDSLLNNIPTLNTARVSLSRIEQVLFELDEQAHIGSPIVDGYFAEGRSLHLTALTHSYYREKEDAFFQLGPINLTIHRGEITFLIGGNGSGKTTLAKLLVGLYKPESGAITVDNKVVIDCNRADYRQLFSVIFSDFHLFETLVGFDVSDPMLNARANDLISKLHLDHKVHIENGHFSTRDLSQGQRKRLALVVAYLEDRPFYLFDEWAADQDPQFKAVFYQELLPELAARGKAVLAITHDDRFFHLADRCLKLENGQLVK
ncbi:cyclic peptide export ABC transporter [Pseudomonas arsenicoxydans]|uniref:Cyclic peptide export ABC transporter n=2 Tax=Pseudomonas arsenicoxydans TaxID=702115 RepID=A0A502GPK2_9PSED|nr:cyclic peptide export ABC transporter [Pseudomonas arsenicoxydans]TPG63831.1 cyclic peptide export ABC transporter [Pseudomonas arsenicoxydans]